MRRQSPALLALLMVVVACGWSPSPALGQTPPPPTAQLDKLVAPIALYPDPLVAQILPASTYPVEVVEAARALATGGRPSQATASQWDPSIQALLSFPTVLKMMSDRIEWTTKLGQAVAANQQAVMAAVQQVRREARSAGNLTSNDKQVVTVQGSGTTSTIIIEPASPQLIYVPQYDPVAVLAPAPYYGYYYAAPSPLLTFGVGFAAGAATAYACDWGYHGGYGSVTVNNTYKYSQTNTYNAYHPYNSSYSSAAYHSNTGTYTGYDSKTGTYGAYNPSTGKYATYNPSTGAYNKDGTTGTWHPPSSSSVGRETDDYRASQYQSSSAYDGDTASGEQYHGGSPSGGGQYGGSQASSRASGGGDVGHLGGGGGWSGGGLGGSADRGSGGGFGGWGSGGRGSGGGGGGGWGSSDRGSGGDAFRGAGGGGWGARDSSSRGWGSYGGGGFGGRGFGGGGFGGFHGGRR